MLNNCYWRFHYLLCVTEQKKRIRKSVLLVSIMLKLFSKVRTPCKALLLILRCTHTFELRTFSPELASKPMLRFFYVPLHPQR
jgi:hypothetical protein